MGENSPDRSSSSLLSRIHPRYPGLLVTPLELFQYVFAVIGGLVVAWILLVVAFCALVVGGLAAVIWLDKKLP